MPGEAGARRRAPGISLPRPPLPEGVNAQTLKMPAVIFLRMDAPQQQNAGKKQSPAKIEAQIKAIPKETAQEAVHQVMTKEEAKEVLKKSPLSPTAKTAADPGPVAPPPGAAKGDDDVMSQPAAPNAPRAEQAHPKRK